MPPNERRLLTYSTQPEVGLRGERATVQTQPGATGHRPEGALGEHPRHAAELSQGPVHELLPRGQSNRLLHKAD